MVLKQIFDHGFFLLASKMRVLICRFVCRTLIQGDKRGGFTLFWADDGLDTGPILLQRECDVDPNDTVDTLYNRFMYPEGIKATVSLQNFSKSLMIIATILYFGTDSAIYKLPKLIVCIDCNLFHLL